MTIDVERVFRVLKGSIFLNLSLRAWKTVPEVTLNTALQVFSVHLKRLRLIVRLALRIVPAQALSRYFFRMEGLCSTLFDDFGRWPDKSRFEAIGDLIEEMVEERVMNIWRQDEGRYSILVPHHHANP
jgi:hypothetical protein